MNMGSYTYLSQIVEPICTQKGWRLVKCSSSRQSVERTVHIEVHAMDTKHRRVFASVAMSDTEANADNAVQIVQVRLTQQIEEHEAKGSN